MIAGPGYEDPCPFWDDNGEALAGPRHEGGGSADPAPHVARRHARLRRRHGDRPGSGQPARAGGVPKVYKRNGWYYIFAPIGGVDKGGEAVGRARAITGPTSGKRC
ncbi:MAG: hypothetical protein WDN06_16950 [Asticcacaulis sp.]